MTVVGAGKLNRNPCTEDEERRNLQVLQTFITNVTNFMEVTEDDAGKVFVSAADTTKDYLYPSMTTAATRDTSADPLIAAAIGSPGGNETLTLFMDSSAISGYSGRQAGDPARAAQAIIRVVESPTPPLNLVLGKDGLKRVREKLDKFSESLRQWESVTVGADFPEA